MKHTLIEKKNFNPESCNRLARALLLVGVATGMAACAAVTDEGYASDENVAKVSESLIKVAQFPQNRQRNIRYCVDNNFPGSFRTTIQNSTAFATRQWANHGDVRFNYVSSEDGRCDIGRTSNPNVDILIVYDGGATVVVPGQARTPSPDWADRRMFIGPEATGPDADYPALLLHEWGHALGFTEEHYHPNADPMYPDWPTAGFTYLTPYDPVSVMHYPACWYDPSQPCHSWSSLTRNDKLGVANAYGIPWESLGEQIHGRPTASTWGPSRLDVFARGTDNRLYHRWFNNGYWYSWESLGGNITGSPAAVAWDNGRIDVFARGAANDLQHTWFTAGRWQGWESLGGYLKSGQVAVTSWGPGRLDVFVRGPYNRLYQRWFLNGWRPWVNLGGNIQSGPAAVAWGNHRIDIVARGANQDVQHLWYSYGWASWESLGGVIYGEPGIGSWDAGRLDIFVRGADKTLFQKYFDNGWSDWIHFPGRALSSGLGVISRRDGQLDLLVRGPENDVEHVWLDPADGIWKIDL